jgi:hypothetical protein
MKAWKKGAIVGVVWGVLNMFVLFVSSMPEGPTTWTSSIDWLKWVIDFNGLSFFLIIALLIFPSAIGRDFAFATDFIMIGLMASLLISVSFGALIGYLYGRWKEK